MLTANGLFQLGKVVGTPGAIEALNQAGQQPSEFLDRHVLGDWGNLDDYDQKVNVDALEHDLRLLSSYQTKLGEDLWVITEADRSVTTLLLPEEY